MRKITRSLIPLFGLLALLASPLARPAEYTLVVQPILPKDDIIRAYTPLAQYLSRQTGEQIRLVTAPNFLGYWERSKQAGEYDLVLDAAHLTAFRMERMDYEPLAKLPDVVSFSLVTGPDTLVFDPDELVGRKLASQGSPSLGAVRLSQLFPNPMRQPIIVEVDDSTVAVQKVFSGEVAAAMIPTPLVQANPGLNTVTTTEQVPHMALSAGPDVPPEVKARIRQALIEAGGSPAGQAMLRQVNLPGFEPASPQQYRGYSELLEGVWGY
ncbi:MAG: PhnD/SsuA/transferrin family substrate-binding protein [Chromatiales bacterium]|nr:PhnD/SsuA/transferrin family substrate-binding protein [Chromatiales bacterium]